METNVLINETKYAVFITILLSNIILTKRWLVKIRLQMISNTIHY